LSCAVPPLSDLTAFIKVNVYFYSPVEISPFNLFNELTNFHTLMIIESAFIYNTFLNNFSGGFRKPKIWPLILSLICYTPYYLATPFRENPFIFREKNINSY